MIWNPDVAVGKSSTLVSHIKGEVDAICGSDVLSGVENVEELARAVEAFVEESGMTAVHTGYLMLLACQALNSLGEGQAARRLLIFGTGLVTPAEWVVTGDRSLLVLDLKQITVHAEASLELILFNSLNMVIETVADVWDECAGAGVLGLRHVCAAATALLGSDDKEEVRRLAAEIKVACTSKLEHLKTARGWRATPSVLALEA